MSRSGAPVALDEDEVLRRARAGDESAFAQLADRFHAELQLHCYRSKREANRLRLFDRPQEPHRLLVVATVPARLSGRRGQ